MLYLENMCAIIKTNKSTKRKRGDYMWMPVAGYEGLYEVSDFGEVKSLNYNHTGKEKVLAKNTIGQDMIPSRSARTQKTKTNLYIFLLHKRL